MGITKSWSAIENSILQNLLRPVAVKNKIADGSRRILKRSPPLSFLSVRSSPLLFGACLQRLDRTPTERDCLRKLALRLTNLVNVARTCFKLLSIKNNEDDEEYRLLFVRSKTTTRLIPREWFPGNLVLGLFGTAHRVHLSIREQGTKIRGAKGDEKRTRRQGFDNFSPMTSGDEKLPRNPFTLPPAVTYFLFITLRLCSVGEPPLLTRASNPSIS